jgi:glycosyltransferase involved in cell wall biosynthesis
MTDERPLVSIILPTYDREQYLREAVASVFAQTYTHWEMIIVDDGSTDGTSAYLAGLADPRVRVVRGTHVGEPGALRNRGIALSRGRYVAFLD